MFTVFFILIFIPFDNIIVVLVFILLLSSFTTGTDIIYLLFLFNALIIINHLPLTMCSLIIYLDRILHLCSVFFYFLEKCNALYFALCHRRECVCVRVCCVYGPQENTLRSRNCFYKLCAITPDIICKSLTQIGLQIPRWRLLWRP